MSAMAELDFTFRGDSIQAVIHEVEEFFCENVDWEDDGVLVLHRMETDAAEFAGKPEMARWNRNELPLWDARFEMSITRVTPVHWNDYRDA